MPAPARPVSPRRGRRARLERLLGAAVGAAVVAGVFLFLLPRIADYGEAWAIARRDLGRLELAALAAATVLNLVTFAPPWMAALPGLRFRQAFVLTQAATAVSIVSPAGAAVGMAGTWALLRSWGFPRSQVSLAVALTGVWNQLANLAFPAAALVLLSASGGTHPALRTAAAAGAALAAALLAAFALALASATRARRLGDLSARAASAFRRLVRRPPARFGGHDAARVRARTLDLLRRRWHALTVATLAGHLTVFLVLLVCLRAVGVPGGEVSLAEAFAAWSLVRILAALPLTPAGVGVVELGLAGALVAFGAPNADAVAATLVYRALTVLPTLALGLAAVAVWRRLRPKSPVESGR